MGVQALRTQRAAAVDSAQAIVDAALADGRELTDEEQASLDGHMARARRLERTIDAALDVSQASAGLEKPQASAVSRVPRMAAPVADPAPQGNESGFKSLGEFISTMRFRPYDDRLQAMQQMDVDSAGGYNVPTEFLPELLRVSPDEALVRPRARAIPAGESPDAAVDIPALDQGTGSNVYGGVTVDWIDEGAAKPETEAAFKKVSLKPHEVAAHIPVTDKLLRNWGAAGGLLQELLRGALIEAEDEAFIRGNGVGKPVGFLAGGNTAAINIPRATANAINYLDVLQMEASAKGSSLVYVYSRTAKTALSQMQDPAGQYIWRDARDGVPATLNGIPAIQHDALSRLGARGDIVLVDLSYYLIKDGFGIAVAVSEHTRFTENITVIKAFTNVDGKAWLTAPYKTRGGDDVSPFVVLDVPGGD